MHSVYKLPISMAVLQRVDRGELKLDQQVKVEPSDFVRKGMYSPVRDKYPDGTELTMRNISAFPFAKAMAAPRRVLRKAPRQRHRLTRMPDRPTSSRGRRSVSEVRRQ